MQKLTIFILSFVLLALTAGATEKVLKVIPPERHEEVQEGPLNIVQKSLGAIVIEVTSENNDWFDTVEGVSELLLGEDAADSITLPVGTTDITIVLNHPSYVSRFSSFSYGAAGSVTVESRLANDDEWTVLNEDVAIEKKKAIESTFPIEQARFIRLTFDIESEGDIGKLAFVGEDTFEQVSSRENVEFDEQENEMSESVRMVPFDFSSVPNGAQITHVSSGDPEEVYKMTDDDVATTYAFDPTEPEHVVLFDMNAEKTLDRVSTVLEAKRGKLEIYMLNTLPENIRQMESEDGEISVGEIQFDDEFFDPIEPAVEKAFESELDRLQIDLDTQQARFVLIRWIKDPVPVGKVYQLTNPEEITLINAMEEVKTVEIGTEIQTGSRLFTGQGAEVHLGLPNKDGLTISENSSVAFVGSRYNANANRLQARIQVNEGLVIGRLDQLAEVKGSSFRIDIPEGTATVTGTRFLAEYREDVVTGDIIARIVVTEGGIAVDFGESDNPAFVPVNTVAAGESVTFDFSAEGMPYSIVGGNVPTASASDAISSAIQILDPSGIGGLFPPGDGGSPPASVFNFGEVSLMGSIPENFSPYAYMPRAMFLQGGSGVATVTPETPPPPPPDLDVISP